MSKRTFQLLLVILLFAGASRAADDAFTGKWKLNPSKSKLIDQMKVASLGANKYAFDFGGGTAEPIVADGTDQPGVFGTTLAVTVEGPNSWKVVRKKGGRMLLTAIWKLSEDGNTLTDHYTEVQANGLPLSVDYVYKRTAGDAGFPGTWESSTVQVNSVFEIEIKPYGDDGLSFINSAQKQTQNMKFDGKDYPNEGPNVPADSASSGRRVDERTLEIIDKAKGKVRATRKLNLSPDHQTLTMTVHPAGQDNPNILVFDRE